MINTFKYLKYSFLLPILFIQFSCEEATTEPTVYNGDVIGSWMLTALTGTYVYTVNLPDGDASGVAWANADTSFGIKATWDMADVIFVGDYAPFAAYGDQWLVEVQSGDEIPGVSQTTVIPSVEFLAGAGVGLIGVFEDAPSAGAYATYKMKGDYPLVSYDYSQCLSAGSIASMTDQGVYTWDQTATTLEIKRDPSIAGTQVLPPFNDGTLTVTGDLLNIQFKDRDSHSSLYAEIPNQTWDEGTHPSLSTGGIDSEGDRTYVAMGTTLPIGPAPDGLGYGNIFYANSTGATGTATIGSDPIYIYNPSLSNWGNYLTYNAWNFQIELAYRGATGEITDALGDGSMADDLVGYMLTALASDATSTTQYFGMPYANLVSMGADGQTPTLTNDSDHDLVSTDLNAGGRMKYSITHGDCAIPADITIDFNATFTKCTTDNCTGDS